MGHIAHKTYNDTHQIGGEVICPAPEPSSKRGQADELSPGDPGVPWSTLENPLKYPKVGVQPRGPQKPPLGCPYRPLISYKIGQMPTVTRGG